jgi:hypothetical protein
MPEPSLELLGANIRQLQADLRTLRGENANLHNRLDQIVDRIATFEAVFETRLDQIAMLIEERFYHLIDMMKAK